MNDPWTTAIYIYVAIVLVTFIPTARAIFRGVKLNTAGDAFAESPHFSDENKKLLVQHYSRILGTLGRMDKMIYFVERRGSIAA